MFLDTGADVCILKQFKLPSHLNINQASRCKITGITDGVVYSLGTVNLSLLIGSQIYEFPFQIVPNNFPIATDGILGRDFILHYNLDLLYSQMEVIFDKTWAVPIFDTIKV